MSLKSKYSDLYKQKKEQQKKATLRREQYLEVLRSLPVEDKAYIIETAIRKSMKAKSLNRLLTDGELVIYHLSVPEVNSLPKEVEKALSLDVYTYKYKKSRMFELIPLVGFWQEAFNYLGLKVDRQSRDGTGIVLSILKEN